MIIQATVLTALEMTTRSIVAWIPIRTPAFDYPDRLPVYQLARDQFLAQLPSVLCSLGSDVEIEVAGLDKPPDELVGWFKQKSFMAGTRLFEYISIVATVHVDEAWLQANPSVEEMFILAVAASQLGKKLDLVLILSELAYPGCITTLEGALVSDGHLAHETHRKSAYTHLSFPEENDPVWPQVQMVELRTIVSWAQQTNMVERHLAETLVERALAAYSHVIGLSWLLEGEALFRAMQGLDAFYSDGIGDLRRQLSEKVQMWLGPWENNKNIVGHLYDLRSAFVHGSARLVYWNHDSDAWDEDEVVMGKFSNGVNLAIRLLLATLQRCAKEGVVDMKWSYAFTTSAK